MVDIQTLAHSINELQSFEYESFGKAKYDLVYGDAKIVVDRITLYFYNHTLSPEVYSELSSKLQNEFEEAHTREELKERKEYLSLLKFFEAAKISHDTKIKKQERPDFVISVGDKRVGVEVTSLSSKDDNQLKTIAKKNFGKGMSAEDLKNAAYENYKSASQRFCYWEINGSSCIGRPMFNIEDDKREFASTIIKKYHKYNRDFEDFDCFIVLCDAMETITVTDEHDADEIINIAFSEEPQMHGFDIAIMYEDDNGRIALHKVCV